MRIKPTETAPTVYIGLSGGVDSSVAAALLQSEGYNVVGAFMRVWQPDFMHCNWQDEQRDAAAVASHLGIPFVTFNLEAEYKRSVVDAMLAEYAAGRTPNPDVLCNRYVKFGAFRRAAHAAGADYVATGHYARVQRPKYNDQSTQRRDTGYVLGTSADTEKDQTYFLWQLAQDDLAHALFPVGGYTKREVRELAERFGLPTARKRDSQGICFIGKVPMREFLAHYLPERSGDVVNASGAVIGWHYGAHFYTVGQRRGFTITDTSEHGPHYVVSRDVSANTVTVDTRPPHMGEGGDIVLESANWIAGMPPDEGRYAARFRHQQPLTPVTVRFNEGGAPYVRLPAGIRAPAAGQSLVVYSADGTRCLGGGIISYAARSDAAQRDECAAARV